MDGGLFVFDPRLSLEEGGYGHMMKRPYMRIEWSLMISAPHAKVTEASIPFQSK